MAAVYPTQYKSFTAHRNLIEDVDASHVNALQEEVGAIEQTLGITPHRDTSLNMKVNTWDSVASRLHSIQRGLGTPAIYLKKDADSYKNTSGSPIKYLSWAKPGGYHDPEGLYNGKSITTNRSGWWMIFGRVVWTNAKGSLATGADREITIAIDGSDVMTQDMVPVSDGNTHMHIGWQGFVTKGRRIDLGIFHPLANKTLSVGFLHLSAAMLREADGLPTSF